jgi:pilus assembly protein CpaB
VSARRRRLALLGSVAIASGALAASEVHRRERAADVRLGPAVRVLVAARDLPAGTRVSRGAVALRRVPARFAPPDAIGAAAAVVGARVAVPVRAGGYLGAGIFEGEREPRRGTRRGRRVVAVSVAAGVALAELAPGSRVDVLVSTDAGAAGGRTVMALAGAELVAVTAGAGGSTDATSNGIAGAEPGGATAPTALATLRVTLRQAIYLTAADNFAREIRLLLRPPGDRSRAGGAVSQGQL